MAMWGFIPSKTILWGDQNWDEMQSGFLGLVVDANVDVKNVFKASGPSLLPRGAKARAIGGANSA